ncbi:MAG: hypothetical protein ABI367_02320 [Mucilaginibacter sp.]
MTTTQGEILFEENQRNVLLVVAIGVIAIPFGLLAIVQIVSHKPVGNHPLPSVVLVSIALASIGGSILASFQKLRLRITTEAIDVSFGFLTSPKTIRLADIKSISIRKYDSMKEFKGWGVRFNDTTTCFTVSGEVGLEITLANEKILIGTQRENDLRLVLQGAVFDGIYQP